MGVSSRTFNSDSTAYDREHSNFSTLFQLNWCVRKHTQSNETVCYLESKRNRNDVDIDSNDEVTRKHNIHKECEWIENQSDTRVNPVNVWVCVCVCMFAVF